MSESKTPNPRTPHPRDPKVGFDERLWPVNCLLFVLSGIVIGLVLGTSRFDDTRLLYNAAFRLAIVAIGIGALFFATQRLGEGLVRRVQLCVLISLLVHLGLGVYLHHKYIELAQLRRKELAEEMVEEYKFEAVPEYDARRIERPDAEEAFEKPLDVRLPDGKEGQTAKSSLEHDIPDRNEQTAEPEPDPRQTDPIQPRRAAISAPRRAEDAGNRLSRQELPRELTPDTPLPQPKIERPEEPPPSAPTSDAANVARRTPESVSTRRRVLESQPREAASPRAVAMDRRSPDRPTSPTHTPTVNRSQQTPHDVVPPQIAERRVDVRDDPLRLADSTASNPEHHRLSPAAPPQPVPQPSPTVEDTPRRPPAAANRASKSTSDVPNLDAAASLESLARANSAGTLPSNARPVPFDRDSLATRGTAPPHTPEITDRTALGRAPKRSGPQRRSVTTGTVTDAVDASRAPARMGDRRATGRERPSLERATAESEIARSRRSTPALADMPTTLPTPLPAAMAEAGDGAERLTVAPGEIAKAARGGAKALPARSDSIGAGPAAVVGAPGRVPLANRRRVTRHEAIPSGISGGGTPLPRRSASRSLSLEATAEPATIASTAPTGAGDVGTPTVSRLAGGPQRHVLGLPGTRVTDPAAGAEPAYTAPGTTEVLGPVRRDSASQRDGRGTSNELSETPPATRVARGTDLPSAAEAIEASSEATSGDPSAVQGTPPGSLELGAQASVRRAAPRATGNRRPTGGHLPRRRNRGAQNRSHRRIPGAPDPRSSPQASPGNRAGTRPNRIAGRTFGVRGRVAGHGGSEGNRRTRGK